jgi:hypothetical protein
VISFLLGFHSLLASVLIFKVKKVPPKPLYIRRSRHSGQATLDPEPSPAVRRIASDSGSLRLPRTRSGVRLNEGIGEFCRRLKSENIIIKESIIDDHAKGGILRRRESQKESLDSGSSPE